MCFLSIHALVTNPNSAIANGLYEFAQFVLSFKTEFAIENVVYEIVPGQVRMTKNDITWHYTRE